MKDEAGNSASERAGVALLHITATSRLLGVLKDDPRAIFTAAAKAQAAADWMHQQQQPQPAAAAVAA